VPGALSETKKYRQFSFTVNTGKRIQISSPEVYIAGAIVAPVSINITVSSGAVAPGVSLVSAIAHRDTKRVTAGFKRGAVTGQYHISRDNISIPGAQYKRPSEQLLQQPLGALGGKNLPLRKDLSSLSTTPGRLLCNFWLFLASFGFLRFFLSFRFLSRLSRLSSSHNLFQKS
jgi:hypothetical protein